MSALSVLSLKQLQTITYKCGLAKSGTKSVLEKRIQTHLAAWKPIGPETRVLSIDLGIRNLGVSLLSPSPAGSVNLVSGTQDNQTSLPQLKLWKRVVLQSSHIKTHPDAEAESSVSGQCIEEEKDLADLSTPALAAMTLKLVEEVLLPLRPTHVLLEAQRFRSGSGSAVQEWTIRVNTLEAMLYAVFTTLRACGRWNGTLWPMDPKRVSTFILEDGDNLKLLKVVESHGVKSTAKRQKIAKIALVASWLRDGTGIRPMGESVDAVKSQFLARLEGRGDRKRRLLDKPKDTPSIEKVMKLDDLADSLIQGVTFIRWQANSAIGQKDITALLTAKDGRPEEITT
jgi:cruciform cutting endonuclease 1